MEYADYLFYLFDVVVHAPQKYGDVVVLKEANFHL